MIISLQAVKRIGISPMKEVHPKTKLRTLGLNRLPDGRAFPGPLVFRGQ